MGNNEEIDLISFLINIFSTVKRYKYIFLVTILSGSLFMFFFIGKPYYQKEIIIETVLPAQLTNDFINNLNNYTKEPYNFNELANLSGLPADTLKKIKEIESSIYSTESYNLLKVKLCSYSPSVLDSATSIINNSIKNHNYLGTKYKKIIRSKRWSLKNIQEELKYLDIIKRNNDILLKEYDFNSYIQLLDRKNILEDFLTKDYIVKKSMDYSEVKKKSNFQYKFLLSLIFGFFTGLLFTLLMMLINFFKANYQSG